MNYELDWSMKEETYNLIKN